MYRAFMTCALVFGLAMQAFAHGMEKNVMGTATEVAADHVVVRTTDGHEVRIAVDANTKFLKDRTPSTAAELKSGARVVVERKGSDEKSPAAEVHFSSSNDHGAAAGTPGAAGAEPSAHHD